MIKYFVDWVSGWTPRQAGLFLVIAVGLSLCASFILDKHYAQASYLFTIPAGFALCLCNLILAWKARKDSLILAVTAFIIGLFMLGFALEEIGWAFWRFYIRPTWFEDSLSPFLKSLQSAGMIANVACLLWFFSGRDAARLPVVGLVSAATVLTFGTCLTVITASLL